MKSKILKVAGLPSVKLLKLSDRQSVVIYDQILLKNSSFKKWIAQFDLSYGVKAGEALKTLKQYEKILQQIQSWQKEKRLYQKVQFISVGGGSVGDFTGFLAATYQRGCPLVQIPSTWLSAIDSAHGGKNGLNFNRAKNQIGSIYPADVIILSKTLLLQQPEQRLAEAFGEIIKICLINQPQLLKKLSSDQKNFDQKFVWNHLEKLVAAKMKIVRKDPFEQKGLRQVLNLGHTMGHVYESCLSLPHGLAVLMGLVFSARWSFHLGYLSQKDFVNITQVITSVPGLDINLNKVSRLSEKQIQQVLIQDKKTTRSNQNQQQIKFIFIKKPGAVAVVAKTVSEILAEVHRQKVFA